MNNNTVHLQYYGNAPAKPASEFKIGEFMLWNYGMNSRISAIKKETPKSITFEEEYIGFSGKVEKGQRRFLKTRLIAISTVGYLKKN